LQVSNAARTALILTLPLCTAGFTDCRFGNRVEQAAVPEEISGYYLTEPSRLWYCAQLSGTENCVETNLSQVPGEIRAIFSNPVGFLVDEETGEAAIFNPFVASNDPPALNTRLDLATSAISHDASSSPTQPIPLTLSNWLPTGFRDCGAILRIEQSGALTSTDAGRELYGERMKGRLSLDLRISRSYTGSECAQTLALFEECFLDAEQCLGTGSAQNTARREEIVQLYAPYLEQQVFEGTDFSSLEGVSYRVEYR
jgi:hypothetical protein